MPSPPNDAAIGGTTIFLMADFRKKKQLYVFNVFFDVNRSGTIDSKDFELAIEKICTLRGWSSGSPQYQKTHTSMMKIWDGLRQRADANNDDQVN
nr:sarcoplasmic calcium-binding proteins I, III, and IV-like [Onthophagus taurus]